MDALHYLPPDAPLDDDEEECISLFYASIVSFSNIDFFADG